ncbi:hypothetical protein D3C74_470390 [compost metagenome]
MNLLFLFRYIKKGFQQIVVTAIMNVIEVNFLEETGLCCVRPDTQFVHHFGYQGAYVRIIDFVSHVSEGHTCRMAVGIPNDSII